MAEKTETPPTKYTQEQIDKLVNHGELINYLASQKKYRKPILSMIREVSPDTPIPELEVEDRVEERVTERVKPFEEKSTKLEERLQGLERTIARSDLRTREGLSEEELVEVETLAKEGDIRKAETAIDYWRAKQLLGTPRATGTGREALSDDERKSLVRNARNPGALKDIVMKRANKVLQELRGGRVRSA